jgi:hypothetical protein
MRLDELPRDDNGAVLGLWKLRHRQPDFSVALGIVSFERGVSTEPLSSPAIDRVMAGLGADVDAEPWEGAGDHVSEPTTPAPQGKPSVPTTAADLEALTEDQLRSIAADLGVTDARWKAQRLRRYIADELGIEDA